MTDIETPSGKTENTENFPVLRYTKASVRPHVAAYYAFARTADDIADNPLLDPNDKIARLDALAAALRAPEDRSIPSAILLRASLAQTGIDPVHALDLLHAFKQDAVKRRYETWDELLDYCRYSASPVGRYMLALHGMGPEVWPASDALCSALQILNHLQDCADDYRQLDRVYLPLDIMASCGAEPSDLAAEASSAGLAQTRRILLDKTTPLVAEGLRLPSSVTDWQLRLYVAVVGAVAERLVRVLEKRDPLCENVKLSRAAKLGAAATGLYRAAWEAK